jgi:hypothetical protein
LHNQAASFSCSYLKLKSFAITLRKQKNDFTKSAPVPAIAQTNRHPENRYDYTIKHYFLRALTLHQAHVYVTLYGHKMATDFYENGDDMDGIAYAPYVIGKEQHRKVEEQMNEDCSYGEHYWHSIKEIDTNRYDGRIIEVNYQFNSNILRVGGWVCRVCQVCQVWVGEGKGGS